MASKVLKTNVLPWGWMTLFLGLIYFYAHFMP
jgi:hypothetical protein